MLLAYFFRHAGVCGGATELTPESAEAARQWVITLQFQRLLHLQNNTTISEIRNVFRCRPRHLADFPLTDLSRAFSRLGRRFGFTREWVDYYCDRELHAADGEKLLSLLYGGDLAVAGLRAVPLVQSRYFMPEELRRAGVPDALHPALQQHQGRLGLAVALDETEATHYYRLPFEQWAQTLSPEQLRRHLLPQDLALYRLDRLPDLIRERRELIAAHLMQRLPEQKAA